MFGGGAGLETGADDGAEGAEGGEGEGGCGVSGGGAGATATVAGLCRHPVPTAIAMLTRITCGSARSGTRRDTLPLSAAAPIIELFG
jgi:hypothetical protein